MAQLFFTNLPHDCSDVELKEWIECRGLEIESIRIISDLVARASPAFAYARLKDQVRLREAISMLDGKRMRNRTISVRELEYRFAR